MGAITIQTQGQTLVVSAFTRIDGLSTGLYSDAGLTTPITVPYVVSTDTTVYAPNAPSKMTITQPDGTVLALADPIVPSGSQAVVITPLPTVAQLAADASHAPTPLFTSGAYYFTSSPHSASTSATQGVGTLRLVPWVVPSTVTITRIGAETTADGDAGSKFRLGIYLDNGSNYPGALLLDAGTIAGDGGAGVKEITLGTPQQLAAGLYWIGGAVQIVSTTQPTMRTVSGWYPPVPLVLGTSAPGAGASAVGVSQASVTGALPSSFSSTITSASSAARVHVKTQ